ncbi:MAG TPA: glycine zipper 2TM domain-containing protein [Rhodopila sp.]|uniref:glycine zipper 2TM domain-containing protein n=1 Tax=Rhodopila sp. TaxID=2480087 RepID=UPI002C0B97F3|nr:glycine zipper 2TM domain-containing protein [Rhodopila sp.]HVY15148.1 glycine zipper 2TM domain-containing protein [Rhodopila sp.]
MAKPHVLAGRPSHAHDILRSISKRMAGKQISGKQISGLGRIALACAVSLPLVTAGCQNNEQTGALLGTGGGALVGGVLGNVLGHSTTATLIGAGVGGALGYFAGSAIGRNLDEADRARASAATQQALATPVYYPPSGAPARPPPRPVSWVSDHNTNVRGSSTVVAVNRDARSGGECKMVREVAYIKGQEEVQNSRYCRSSDGSWVAQA